VRFCRLVKAMGTKYRHIVVAMDGNFDCKARIPRGCQVECFEYIQCRRSMLSRVLHLRKELKKLRPNVLVTYNWGTIEWAMANVFKVVRHIHVEDGFGPQEVSTRLRRRSVARRLLLRSSVLVVPSQRLKQIALKEWRLHPQQIYYIPNGIDCDRLRALAATCPAGRFGWLDGGPVIGTVATLRPEKNIGRLLRAFRLFAATSPCRLIIVGDGPEKGSLEALSAELGLADRIHFTGYMEEPEVAYGGFDVFALSSDTEQMPLSVLEAMAAGLPIAATEVGDIADMVAPSNKRFVTARNEAELAANLETLLSDANERTRIGRENHNRMREQFTQDAMVLAYARLFDA